MKDVMRVVAGLACLIVSHPAANAEPAVSMTQVGNAILACWKPPAGIEKSSVTLSLSLKEDGSLLGPPVTTNIDIPSTEKARREFVEAAMEAVRRCTPVALAPALAQGIAGQVFTLEFATDEHTPALSPEN